MVKSIISVIVVSIILVVGTYYENQFINKQFTDFQQVLEAVYQKVDDKSATKEDILALQKNWLDKKKMLFIFIPHTEIKEIDMWLSEAVTLVRDKHWADAISKIEVLTELAEQIPLSFILSLENLM